MRSILMAIGIFLLILGGESLIVDKVVLNNGEDKPKIVTQPQQMTAQYGGNNGAQGPFKNAGYQTQPAYYQTPKPKPKKVFQTKEWMPWSLLAAGAIIVLYTYSMPKRDGHSDE